MNALRLSMDAVMTPLPLSGAERTGLATTEYRLLSTLVALAVAASVALLGANGGVVFQNIVPTL
jgi:Flp pilus assembly pilin Flp